MQTRKASFFEANANSIIGLAISYLFTLFCLPLFGLHPNPVDAGGITLCYFFLSTGRSFVIRRVFNARET